MKKLFLTFFFRVIIFNTSVAFAKEESVADGKQNPSSSIELKGFDKMFTLKI